ncbi:hypothetical protein [Aureliella helgolandensis]|nr:hypothetical protein [Aureliella helgolandensis]
MLKDTDKPLCKLKKTQLQKLLPEIAADLPNCRYICRKCARVAHSKRHLCKPQSISLLGLQAEDD